MKISKHAIKEIALTAQYRPGNYFEPGTRATFASTLADAPNASHCIVGALVRTYGPPDLTLSAAYALAERLTQGVGCSFSPRNVARRGNYMGALSAHLENITTLTDNMVTEEVREELAAFIDKYFPDFLELPLDAVRPGEPQ